jgi:hypothetical protein
LVPHDDASAAGADCTSGSMPAAMMASTRIRATLANL